jgi:hypothetical protein
MWTGPLFVDVASVVDVEKAPGGVNETKQDARHPYSSGFGSRSLGPLLGRNCVTFWCGCPESPFVGDSTQCNEGLTGDTITVLTGKI